MQSLFAKNDLMQVLLQDFDDNGEVYYTMFDRIVHYVKENFPYLLDYMEMMYPTLAMKGITRTPVV